MAVDRRVVVGTYDSQNEVATEVRRLIDEGYAKEKITVYTNADNLDALRDSQDVNVEAEGTVERPSGDTEEKGLWQEIKDAFSTDTYDYDDLAQDPTYTHDDDVLFPYRDDIAAGKMIIVVEDFREDTDTNEGATVGIERDIPENTNRTETTVRESADHDSLTEDEKIRLKEERLEVGKEEVQTGEVNVRKETVHDTETVDVPVEREEVIIERKPVVGEDSETSATDIDEESESYTIPVKEEQVEVTKKPVVKEEVEIRKERHEDVEHVSEDVKREEIDVETEGRTNLNDPENDLDRRNDR